MFSPHLPFPEMGVALTVAAAAVCNMRCDAMRHHRWVVMGCTARQWGGRCQYFRNFRITLQSPHFVRTFLASFFIFCSPNTPFSIITFIAFRSRLRPKLCVQSRIYLFVMESRCRGNYNNTTWLQTEEDWLSNHLEITIYILVKIVLLSPSSFITKLYKFKRV